MLQMRLELGAERAVQGVRDGVARAVAVRLLEVTRDALEARERHLSAELLVRHHQEDVPVGREVVEGVSVRHERVLPLRLELLEHLRKGLRGRR